MQIFVVFELEKSFLGGFGSFVFNEQAVNHNADLQCLDCFLQGLQNRIRFLRLPLVPALQ
jgi:hypothetical protein